MDCPRCGAAMETGSAARSRCPVCGFEPAADGRGTIIPLRRSPVASARRKRSVIRPIAPPPDTITRTVDPPAETRRSVIRPIQPPPEHAPAEPSARAPEPEPVPAPQPADVPGNPIVIDLPNRIKIHDTSRLMPRQRVRFEGRVKDAEFALLRDDPAAARSALRSALDVYDLSDSLWLFLAGLAETRAEQREYLEEALACNPQNQIAIEALLRLDGRLSLADRAPADDGSLAADEIAGRRMMCPRCGGSLSYNVREKLVACYSCGHRIVDADDLARTRPGTLLQVGLVKRKRAARPWNIGGRWLRCTSCGAITTLSRLTLTTACRFCDSHHIVQEGANLPFEQPDVIVPFSVDERTAQDNVRQHLSSGLRLITRLFADAVEHIELRGVYLPFWIFDAIMDVKWSWSNAPDHGMQPVLLDDVLQFAADTPDARLLQRLEPFDVRRGVDYDPRLLANIPAELYLRDVDRASLDVRTRLTRDAERHARPALTLRRPSGYGSQYGAFGSDSERNPGRLKLKATTRSLTYRFGLLPVWFGRMVEADGDTQPVLVNGQTGKVILGAVEKHRT